MKILFKIILVLLIFLAVSSGITKIMLMQQELDLFGQYGFTNPILIGFGIVQLLGGILLAVPKTRVIGAVTIAITFLISAGVLIKAGNIPLAIITLIFTLLLGFVIKHTLSDKS